jgi:hypothetical protein
MDSQVSVASTIAEADGDAILMDWVAASYLAPCIAPRPHAIVVRAWEPVPQGLPALIVVTAGYPTDSAARPSGVEMIRNEGRLVGDAIVVARGLGVVLNTVVVDRTVFEQLAQNEHVDPTVTVREFLTSAMTALKPVSTPTRKA